MWSCLQYEIQPLRDIKEASDFWQRLWTRNPRRWLWAEDDDRIDENSSLVMQKIELQLEAKDLKLLESMENDWN